MKTNAAKDNVMKIVPDYAKIRNTMHFNIQLKMRGKVLPNRKVYNRQKYKRGE